MKILFLGDIHGLSHRKEYVEKIDYDKVVFIGDYFDSFDVNIASQLENFYEILKFKEESKKEVVLLVGNHDYHYINYVDERYSGFNFLLKINLDRKLFHLIESNVLQLCWSHKDLIASHAGFSQNFVDYIESEFGENFRWSDFNKVFKDNLSLFGYYKGDLSGSGNDKRQGPLRIRPGALLDYSYKKFKYQIVGHTRTEEIVNKELMGGGNIIFIDSMPKYALIAENNGGRKFTDVQLDGI